MDTTNPLRIEAIGSMVKRIAARLSAAALSRLLQTMWPPGRTYSACLPNMHKSYLLQSGNVVLSDAFVS
jgi:hypothetical protein